MAEEKNKKEEVKNTEEEKDQKEESVKEEKKDDSSEKEGSEEEVEVPEKFADLVQKIENLSVLELSELVKILEKKFGVSASAPAAVAVAPGAAGNGGDQGEGEEEKSEYAIHLKGVGDKKIEVIKAVRTITEQGLKEAKDLVDAAVDSPQVVKEGVATEDAKKAEQILKDAGAVVELK